MSLGKYGLEKPKQTCKVCYTPINPVFKKYDKNDKNRIPWNKRINCEACKKSVCVMCSYEYDGLLYCEKCGIEIDEGGC